jgi:hypothetical protein
VLIILSSLIFFYKLVSVNKDVKVIEFLKAMFTKYNAHRYIALVLLKVFIVSVYIDYYLHNESKKYLSIIQCIFCLTVDIEPFVSVMTLYVLVHTSFVSANDILVTFGGLIVVTTPDPKRAFLKSVLKRRNQKLALQLALPGVATLPMDPLTAPVNILLDNSVAIRGNDNNTEVK